MPSILRYRDEPLFLAAWEYDESRGDPHPISASETNHIEQALRFTDPSLAKLLAHLLDLDVLEVES
jgi:hypothetical protein